MAKALRNKFDYTTLKETRATDVLVLKVKDPSLPGLTISSPGEKQRGSYKHGELYLTRFQLTTLLPHFEQSLKIPIVDETGLTNCYDLSLPWNIEFLRQMDDETTARITLDKVLATWASTSSPAPAPSKCSSSENRASCRPAALNRRSAGVPPAGYGGVLAASFWNRHRDGA